MENSITNSGLYRTNAARKPRSRDRDAKSVEDDLARRRKQKRAFKPQLLSRDKLDGRTNAAKQFERLVEAIHLDLGGRSQLSAIEIALVEAFAGAAVTLENLNVRLLLGEQIDFSEHAQAVSAMVRVAARLGLQRRPRDINGVSFGELLRADHTAQVSEPQS